MSDQISHRGSDCRTVSRSSSAIQSAAGLRVGAHSFDRLPIVFGPFTFAGHWSFTLSQIYLEKINGFVLKMAADMNSLCDDASGNI